MKHSQLKLKQYPSNNHISWNRVEMPNVIIYWFYIQKYNINFHISRLAAPHCYHCTLYIVGEYLLLSWLARISFHLSTRNLEVTQIRKTIQNNHTVNWQILFAIQMINKLNSIHKILCITVKQGNQYQFTFVERCVKNFI